MPNFCFVSGLISFENFGDDSEMLGQQTLKYEARVGDESAESRARQFFLT